MLGAQTEIRPRRNHAKGGTSELNVDFRQRHGGTQRYAVHENDLDRLRRAIPRFNRTRHQFGRLYADRIPLDDQGQAAGTFNGGTVGVR